MTMLRVILWCLTVFESVSDSGNKNFDTCLFPRVKCDNGCVKLTINTRNIWNKKIICACGDTNLTYTDVYHYGKHCCLDQTCTGKIKFNI